MTRMSHQSCAKQSRNTLYIISTPKNRSTLTKTLECLEKNRGAGRGDLPLNWNLERASFPEVRSGTNEESKRASTCIRSTPYPLLAPAFLVVSWRKRRGSSRSQGRERRLFGFSVPLVYTRRSLPFPRFPVAKCWQLANEPIERKKPGVSLRTPAE